MVMTVAITREEYSATRVRTHYPSQNVMVAAMQNGGEECVSAAIVASSDAAPVLEAAEGILDAMPLAIESLVIWYLDLA